MTTTATDPRTSAVGTGAVQTVSFTFPIVNNSDITVKQRITATGVETTLTETTHYTVTNNGSAGGSITTVTPFVASTAQIHIIRNTPMTQTLDLEAGGSFNAENIEAAADKNTRLIIENSDAIDRSLRMPDTDSDSLTTIIPSAVDRASKNLTFDSSGNVTATSVAATGSVSVSAYGEDLVAAASSAAAKRVLDMPEIFDAQDYTLLSDAVTAAANSTLVISTNIAVTVNTIIPSTVSLIFRHDGLLTITSTKIVTINGPMQAGLSKIFSGDTDCVLFGAGVVDKVYPQWWGAVADGDGSTGTDNSDAFTSAITSLPSIGGVIRWPAGKYDFDTTVTLPDTPKAVTIEGAFGAGSQGGTQVISGTFFYFRATDSTNFLATGNDATRKEIVLKDFGIQGNGSDGIGIYIRQCNNGKLERIHIRGMGSHGILMHNCWDVPVIGCFIYNNGGWGIVSTRGSSQTFQDCVVQNNDSGNLTINDQTLYLADSATRISGIRIIGGDYSMSGANGNDNPGIKLYYVGESCIDGVYIEDSFTGDRDSYPMYITGKTAAVAVAAGSVMIRNCLINLSSVITGGTGYPVYLKYMDNVTFSNNYFSIDANQTAATASTALVYVDGYVENLICENNRLIINDVPTEKDPMPYIATTTGCANIITSGFTDVPTAIYRQHNGTKWSRIVNTPAAYVSYDNAQVFYDNEIVFS